MHLFYASYAPSRCAITSETQPGSSRDDAKKPLRKFENSCIFELSVSCPKFVLAKEIRSENKIAPRTPRIDGFLLQEGVKLLRIKTNTQILCHDRFCDQIRENFRSKDEPIFPVQEYLVRAVNRQPGLPPGMTRRALPRSFVPSIRSDSNTHEDGARKSRP